MKKVNIIVVLEYYNQNEEKFEVHCFYRALAALDYAQRVAHTIMTSRSNEQEYITSSETSDEIPCDVGIFSFKFPLTDDTVLPENSEDLNSISFVLRDKGFAIADENDYPTFDMRGMMELFPYEWSKKCEELASKSTKK